jgi:hypothetical protein
VNTVRLIDLKPGERFRLRSDRSGRSGREGMIFEAGDSLKGAVTNAHYVEGWNARMHGAWFESEDEIDGAEVWFSRDRRVVRVP